MIQVKEIYELQNIGKGIITSLVPDNLLKITPFPVTPGFQDVLDEDPNLPFGNTVNIAQYFYLKAASNMVEVNNPSIVSSIIPATRIGKGIGNTSTDVSLSFFPTQAIFTDGQNSRGLEYAGNYEANFTNRSLITKQYFTNNLPVIDGSETKVNAGTNVTITGNGTIATPYIINSTASGGDGSETKINAGTNISVTGTGTIGSPYIINNTQTVDGSETKLISGTTTFVSGNGTIATPYKVETVNLQKSITSDYTILPSDNNYSIKVNNGSTSITITVPTGLPENFFTGFTQKGTADVTFVGSGTTITNPIGLKIKGQGYCVGLEQIGTSNSFDLMADTKA